MTDAILLGFGLTTLAGLSTGFGSALAFFADRTHTGFLSASLGFSAGVMIHVSFLELYPEALRLLTAPGGKVGVWANGGLMAAGAFFAGMLLITLLDVLVPSGENPHEAALVEDMGRLSKERMLRRSGVFAAMAVAVHNFPEGIATLLATISDPKVGITVALAVALHNIPEGISISVPVFFATGSRRKAFWYSFLSGGAEPLGALLGYALLHRMLFDTTLGLLFAGTAGVMVFLAVDQLLPNAKTYGHGHESVYGMIAGMALTTLGLNLM